MADYLGLIDHQETGKRTELPSEKSEISEKRACTCSICSDALIPTVAAYGLGRCSVHMTGEEFLGWLRFHRDHWRDYYDPKTGERR